MFPVPFHSRRVLGPFHHLRTLPPALSHTGPYSDSPFNFNFSLSDALKVVEFITTTVTGGNRTHNPPPHADHTSSNSHPQTTEDRYRLHEPRKMYPSHIPTSALQRALLLGGSAVGSFLAPQRDDMIATFGEVSGYPALLWIRQRMMSDETGRAILRLKPRIRTTTINMSALRQLPNGTLGREYSNFMALRNFTPDARKEVRYVDDPELAYVLQRYRELHDFTHTLLQMPTNLYGEIVVKWFEAVQTGLPLCVFGGIFAPLRLTTEKQSELFTVYAPWAVMCALKAEFLMNVFFEQHFEEPIAELRRRLRITSPPQGTLTKF